MHRSTGTWPDWMSVFVRTTLTLQQEQCELCIIPGQWLFQPDNGELIVLSPDGEMAHTIPVNDNGKENLILPFIINSVTLWLF